MARQDRYLRRIDERNDRIVSGGGDLIQIGSSAPTMGGIIQPPEPENVTIGTQVLLRTTYTPKVAVNVSWGAPPNLLPEFYLVEYAESDDFTLNPIRVTTSLNRIALEMKPDTDYWVRVKAMIRNMYSDWGYPSSYPSVSVHTIGDTTPPNAVSGVTANWTTGDLILKWTNPTSSNFFRTRVRIYNTLGGTLYKEVMIVGNPGATSEYRFTVDENNEVTANNPLTTVYYELLAYSLAGIPALSAVTGNITKAKPSIPTGLSSSWSGDDGTFDETVTLTWNAVAGAKDYRVVIDGVEHWTPALQYTYTYSENVSNHRPTVVSGDYALAFTVQSRDPLNQVSPGASGTATNIAPQASNITLNVVPGFSSLYAYITTANDILDLYAYNWTLKSGGVNVRQTVSFTPEVSFPSLNGIYELQVYAVDKFGQRSATLSGTYTLDGLTIEQLRAETQYTNSLGTNPTTLAGLKDNNLVQSVFTVPSGTVWQWTKAERPLLDRYRTFTVAFSGAATNMPRVYFSTSTDDSNFTYFSGPLVSTGVIAGNTTLTQYASEASAQANAVLATNINRYDLPSITEARFIKMHHRGNIHHVTEYFPRRVVQSDDMEAETIKGINIAADAIIADHISVTELSAITANIGGLVINTGGYLFQGTGTPASPITGLKIYNSGGIGKLSTYNSGTEQIKIDTDGVLKAGAGAVLLDSTGIRIVTDLTLGDLRSYKLIDTGGNILGGLYSYVPASTDHLVKLFTKGRASSNSYLDLESTSAGATLSSQIRLYASRNNGLSGNGAHLTLEDLNAVNGAQIYAEADQVWVQSNGAPFTTYGTNSGIRIADRVTATQWQLYGSTSFRLWNGSTDILSVTTAGNLQIDGDLNIDGGELFGPSAQSALLMTDEWLRINPSNHFANGTYVVGYFRADGGLMSGNATNPGAGNVGFTGNLKPYVGGVFYDTYSYVPLSSNLTNTSYDGDAVNIGTYTLNANTGWGVPSGAKAIYVRLIAQFAAAGSGNVAFLRSVSGSAAVISRAYAANILIDSTGIVALNASNQFSLDIAGANSAATHIYILGYFL